MIDNVSAKRVMLLTTDGVPARLVYNGLRKNLDRDVQIAVVTEERVSRARLLQRRAQRLGVTTALGQVAFSSVVVPFLKKQGRARIAEILHEHDLDSSPLPESAVRVSSANSIEAHDIIRDFRPSVVVIQGTRILSKTTLATTPAPFINMHAGITPAYRGVHGGYWALRDIRPEMVGTTIHRVDEGIDTGQVIEQVIFSPTSRDTFATYPYLHLAKGLPALVRAVTAALDDSLVSRNPAEVGPSELRYHPTFWQYLYGRVTSRAK